MQLSNLKKISIQNSLSKNINLRKISEIQFQIIELYKSKYRTEINEEVKPIDTRCLPPASIASLGAVKQAASVPDGSDINTLLAALREAGIIAPLEQT